MKEVDQQLRTSINRQWHPLDWVALGCAGVVLIKARTLPLERAFGELRDNGSCRIGPAQETRAILRCVDATIRIRMNEAPRGWSALDQK
jgi:hypothetical protein